MTDERHNPKRAQEAGSLCRMLSDVEGRMKPKEREFLTDMSERLEKYGDGTFVSEKQIEWLRRLQSSYL